MDSSHEVCDACVYSNSSTQQWLYTSPKEWKHVYILLRCEGIIKWLKLCLCVSVFWLSPQWAEDKWTGYCNCYLYA